MSWLKNDHTRLKEENAAYMELLLIFTKENNKLKSEVTDLRKYKVKWNRLEKTRVVRG